jgi:hypothetical protein
MLTEFDVQAMVISPFYAVTLAPRLFKATGQLGSKEDWVAASASAVKDMGSRAWLDAFLSSISLESADDHPHDFNPASVVRFSSILDGEHEPMVERNHWVNANVKLMGELGVEPWLWRLLEVLETGGPTNS